MGDKLPWFRFFVNDWLLDTMTMTLEQQGAYMRLLCFQWRDGLIPGQVGTLAAICNADEQRFEEEIWPRVAVHFRPLRDGLQNPRLERERRKTGGYQAHQSDKGRRSGIVRRSRARAKATNRGSTPVQPRLNQEESDLDPDSDLDLREREKLLTPDRIGPDPEESQERVAEDDGEDLRPPTRTELSALATLFQDYPERHAVRDHNTSAVYGSQAYAVTIRFLAPLFPDSRPGAGLSKEVTEWTGKIPIRDCAIAVREITRKLYPSVNGGRERTWNELDPGIQKRIVTHEFNAMLPVSG